MLTVKLISGQSVQIREVRNFHEDLSSETRRIELDGEFVEIGNGGWHQAFVMNEAGKTVHAVGSIPALIETGAG